MDRQAEFPRHPQFLGVDLEVRAEEGTLHLVHKTVGVRHRLTIPEALCLSFLAATDDPVEVARAVSTYLDEDSGTFWVKRVTERYRTYLCGESPRGLDLNWIERLEPARLRTLNPLTRLSAPASVTWVVTLYCHRRCIYCSAPVRFYPIDACDSPPDAVFPLPDVLRLIDHMALAGTADLHLTGGEPLLRKDLPKIIRAAKQRRIRVHMITKYPIKTDLALALADAGLFEATVSLDDSRPDRVARLAGRDYLEAAKKAILALSAAGVPVKVHAVVTRVNRDGLDRLTRLAADLGANGLTFGPLSFPDSMKEKAGKFFPGRIDWNQEARRLSERFAGRMKIETVGAPIPASKEEGAEPLVCESGIRTLDVLPDGRVTICRLLPERRDLVVGDLRCEDLKEVWNGKRIHAFVVPSPEQFAGTDCAECSDFDSCNHRGRCYLQAIETCGRLFGPDPFCIKREDW